MRAPCVSNLSPCLNSSSVSASMLMTRSLMAMGTSCADDAQKAKRPLERAGVLLTTWLRGQDLNLRPLGYEPNELPDCSTARQMRELYGQEEASSPALALACGSGRSTSSTSAIGALSPTRKPIFRMRV